MHSGFDALLDGGGELREEVNANGRFQRVDGNPVRRKGRQLGSLIRHHEGDAGRVGCGAQDGFPIGGWHLYGAIGQLALRFQPRAADHVDLTEFMRPVSCGLFELLPTAAIELRGLRGDVGHQETGGHAFAARFGVRCGLEVAPVKSTVGVVLVYGRSDHTLIAFEAALALGLAQGLCRQQFVGHPPCDPAFGIEIDHIIQVDQAFSISTRRPLGVLCFKI